MGITTCRLEGPVDFYSVGQFVSGPGWRHLRRTIDTFELMFELRPGSWTWFIKGT